MRTGIFGGTFNPPHLGHRKALENFIKNASLDKAIVTVTGTPPHKKLLRVVSDEDRLKMAEIAFGDISEVSDFEIQRGGKSYTIDTLEYFKQYDDDLYLYMGSDMILNIETVWHRFEDIFKICTVVVLSRTGDDLNKLNTHAKYLKDKYGANIKVFETSPFVVSSTQIREKIKNGADFSGYLPAAVEKYIKENNLYKC
ncbi:MAG: nicotinate (nicotinamide) nucleotide adenylyltransferase [Clostridiales bacterium]|nr:MAG: nicotinate (nicotinamide) nucleotide adenylyltransferase [Clostridiales bacterium]